MKLLFRERLFSWLDRYDVYDESQNTCFTVQGRLALGHRLEIADAEGNHIATLQEKVLSLLPKFQIYMGALLVGEIAKDFSFFNPRFSLNCHGWQVEGSILEWDYRIVDQAGAPVAQIEKQLFNFTDTYVIDVVNPNDALLALMVTLAIDAAKCSGNR